MLQEELGIVEDNSIVEGFVEEEKDSGIFTVTREAKAQIIPYQSRRYFRTREIADVLNCKQPFQFVAKIKGKLGEDKIVSGNGSEEFRMGEDSIRTTFIDAKDLYAFLVNEDKDKYDADAFMRVCEALKVMIQNY